MIIMSIMSFTRVIYPNSLIIKMTNSISWSHSFYFPCFGILSSHKLKTLEWCEGKQCRLLLQDSIDLPMKLHKHEMQLRMSIAIWWYLQKNIGEAHIYSMGLIPFTASNQSSWIRPSLLFMLLEILKQSKLEFHIIQALVPINRDYKPTITIWIQF